MCLHFAGQNRCGNIPTGTKCASPRKRISLRLLAAFACGEVYYDPGIKLENATTKPKKKNRSQFRVASRNIKALYETVKVEEV